MRARSLIAPAAAGAALMSAAPAALADAHQNWRAAPLAAHADHGLVVIGRTGFAPDPLLKGVTTAKRQERGEALRIRLQLVKPATVTIRLRTLGEDAGTWRPLRLRGKTGANSIRIRPGKNQRMPAGRYRVKVSARAGSTHSRTWTRAVRIVG